MKIHKNMKSQEYVLYMYMDSYIYIYVYICIYIILYNIMYIKIYRNNMNYEYDGKT